MRWHRRDPMAPGALRRECRRILREMPVPDPFTVAGFIRNFEEERGREIRLVELPADVPGQTGACGLWVKHRQRPLDLILHVQGTTKFHRKKIIFHELCHLWCEDGSGAEREQLALLFPGMPPEMIDRLLATGQVLARSGYATHAEARAETLADLLHHETRHIRITGDVTLRNLDESLSRPIAGPRRKKVLPHD
jgi:hypothetical protein